MSLASRKALGERDRPPVGADGVCLSAIARLR